MNAITRWWKRLNKSKCMLYLVVMLAVFLTGLALRADPKNSIYGNLFTEAIGIFFTVVVVEFWFRSSERENWRETERKLNHFFSKMVGEHVFKVRLWLVMSKSNRVRTFDSFFRSVGQPKTSGGIDTTESSLLAVLEDSFFEIDEQFLSYLQDDAEENLHEIKISMNLSNFRTNPQLSGLLLDLIGYLESYASQLHLIHSVKRNNNPSIEEAVLRQISNETATRLIKVLRCCRQLQGHLNTSNARMKPKP